MQSGKITALEMQKRNKERVNIYLDDEYAFSITLIEAAKLKKGQVLTAEEIEVLKNEDTINKAVERGVRFLSYRPRSIQEVRRNLVKHETAESVIELALERLINLGYLDDRAFAKYWLENRDTFKPRGPMALRHELRQKGIDNGIVDELLSDLDVFTSAYRAAQPRLNRLRGLDQKTFKHKINTFLQRRGFTYGTIREVIEQLITEIVEDESEYFSENEEEM